MISVECDICGESFDVPTERHSKRHLRCTREYRIQYKRAYDRIRQEAIDDGDSQYLPESRLNTIRKIAKLKARLVVGRLKVYSKTEYENRFGIKYNLVDDEAIADDLYDRPPKPSIYDEIEAALAQPLKNGDE